MKKNYISPSVDFIDFVAEEDMLTNSHPESPIAVVFHTTDPDPTEWSNVSYVGLFEEETVDGISDWSDEVQF